MSARKLILVLLALVIAGATVQFTRSLLNQNRAPAQQAAAVAVPQAPRGPKVLVAAADLPAGTLVQPAHLRWLVWPAEGSLPPTYVIEGQRPAEEFHGAVVRRGILAGEPVFEGRVVKPGDRGFMAAVLQPGMRAVSVAINGASGVAGFVFPGDRVDLVLTHMVGGDDGNKDRRVGETVLSDVRVLALDQRHNDQKGEVKTAGLATLEVTPRQAEWIAVAASLGQLSLSLRSLGGAAPAEGQPALAEEMAAEEGRDPTHTITWDSDVSRALGGWKPAAPAPAPAALPTESTPIDGGAGVITVQVIRGSGAAEVTFPQR